MRLWLPSVLLSLLATGLWAQATESLEAETSYKVLRRWRLELPRNAWAPLGERVLCHAAPQGGYRVQVSSQGLAVDVDGDGECEGSFSGKEGVLAFGPAGAARQYSVRVRNGASGWQMAPGGARVGTLGGTRILLVDQNLNGRYDDFGEDAMVLGRGKFLSYLSKVLSIDGKLYALQVSPDGSVVKGTPYGAEVGALDLRSRFESDGKLLWGLVANKDRSLCFDVASCEGALQVPAGRYHFLKGLLGQGRQRVGIAPGRMSAIEVSPGEDSSPIRWGGPVIGEFEYQRRGTRVSFDPSNVRYFGQQGEEYFGWSPIGKSPKFVLTNRKTGKEVATAFFPGSC